MLYNCYVTYYSFEARAACYVIQSPVFRGSHSSQYSDYDLQQCTTVWSGKLEPTCVWRVEAAGSVPFDVVTMVSPTRRP